MPCWRVFPWNPGAPDGAPFSARYVPPAGLQTGGRFDLGSTPVLYLAESPAHALAEVLQGYRGKRIRAEHLVRGDPGAQGTYHPFALVEATLPIRVEEQLADLTNPAVLLRLQIRPDQLASENRELTRATARRLFLDRVQVASIDYSAPEPLDAGHPAVRQAARFLDILLPAA